jgi:hypothetical protein
MNEKLKNIFEKLEMLKDAIEEFSREVDEERVIIKKESFSKIEFVVETNTYYAFKYNDVVFFILSKGSEYHKEILEKLYSAKLDRLILNKSENVYRLPSGIFCNYLVEPKNKTDLKDLYPEPESDTKK